MPRSRGRASNKPTTSRRRDDFGYSVRVESTRAKREVVTLPPVSWNQIVSWLKQIGALRQPA